MGDKAECNVALRFNFLSTDFSISKGVEGTICRLCVKTEVLSSGLVHWISEIPEMCFCELKLFRHHGSDRKLKNDFVHMRKAMDKLNQQIAVDEIEFGNRKQTTSWIRTKAISGKFPSLRVPPLQAPLADEMIPRKTSASSCKDCRTNLQGNSLSAPFVFAAKRVMIPIYTLFHPPTSL
jgi:hypothetical protein